MVGVSLFCCCFGFTQSVRFLSRRGTVGDRNLQGNRDRRRPGKSRSCNDFPARFLSWLAFKQVFLHRTRFESPALESCFGVFGEVTRTLKKSSRYRSTIDRRPSAIMQCGSYTSRHRRRSKIRFTYQSSGKKRVREKKVAEQQHRQAVSQCRTFPSMTERHGGFWWWDICCTDLFAVSVIFGLHTRH